MTKKGIILFMMLFLALVPLAFASSVTRSFSTSVLSPGSSLDVTLNVIVDPGDTYYAIDEVLPAGWTITNNGGGDASDPGHIKWVVITGAASTSYTYTVTAPSTPNSYVFEGTYGFGLDELDIMGDTTVSVSGGADTTPPVISEISVSADETTATISWQTDEQADSLLEIGTTPSLGENAYEPTLTTSRNFDLTGLMQGQEYYYKATSCDASDNCASSSVLSFTTSTSSGAGSDDLNVNYIRGRLLLDGVPAEAGRQFVVTVIDGENAGQHYVGTVDQNIPSHLRGNGYFDTGDQVIFSTGATFIIDGYSGYSCDTQYTGIFQNGGNGDLSLGLVYDCTYTPNYPPQIDSKNPSGSSVTISEGSVQIFSVTASDPDMDLPLTYSWELDGDMVSTSSSYTYSPDYDDAGTHTLSVTVTDSALMSVDTTWTVVVENSNRNPVLDPIGALTATEDQQFEYTVTATDSDAGDILTFSTDNSILPINSATGVIRFTPTQAQTGTYNVEVTVRDNHGATDSEVITLTILNVNDAPVLSSIGNKNAYEEKEFVLQLQATDEDGDALTYTTNSPIGILDPLTGEFKYTPPRGSKTSYDIDFTVSDGQASDTESMTLTVYPVIELSSVQLRVDGDTENVQDGDEVTAKPNSDIKANVEVRNNIDKELYGITVSYEMPQLGITGEEVINSLGPGQDISKMFEFDLPSIISEGTYDLIIRAEDMTNDHQQFWDEMTVQVTVDKENNEIIIENLDIDQNPVQCTKNNQVNVSLVNTGVFDQQDVVVRMRNPSLGIDFEETIANFPANTRINLHENVVLSSYQAGSYDIDIAVEYFYTKEVSDSIRLTVEPCTVTNIYPDPSIWTYITEDGQQEFGLDAPDGVTVQWYINGTYVGSGETYTYYGDGAQGRYDMIVSAQVDDLVLVEWGLTQTSYPITDEYGGDTTNFSTWTEWELQHATGIIFHRPGVAKIIIPGPVDVSDIPTFNGLVMLETQSVGLDTSVLDVFVDQNGTIEVYNKDLPEPPKVLYNEGFTADTQEINQYCDFCHLTYYDEVPTVSGDVYFNVDHFTVFGVVVNHVPVITSSPITNAFRTEHYSYNVNAYDVDGNSLVYSIVSGPAGMGIDASTGMITWMPDALGLYDVEVAVDDGFGGNDVQIFTIDVKEPPKLKIDEIEVKVDGSRDKVGNGDKIRDKALPGDTVKFGIKVCNRFTDEEDISIEDVKATVTIENIDDGDDMDAESDRKDIRADDCKDLDVEIELPYDAEEDEYDAVVEVEGEDENGEEHYEQWQLTLEVEREKHSIIIRDIRIIPNKVRPPRDIVVEMFIQNIGQDDEDNVAIRVFNEALGIDIKDAGIELDNDMNDDDSEFSKRYIVPISGDALPGSYPIRITTMYDGTKVSETRTVELTVDDVSEREEDTDEYGSPSTTLDRKSGTGDRSSSVQIQRTLGEIGKDVHEPRLAFVDNSDYLILLIVIIIVDIGLLGFIAMLLASRAARRRRRER